MTETSDSSSTVEARRGPEWEREKSTRYDDQERPWPGGVRWSLGLKKRLSVA
jgi:hypothetical protein